MTRNCSLSHSLSLSSSFSRCSSYASKHCLIGSQMAKQRRSQRGTSEGRTKNVICLELGIENASRERGWREWSGDCWNICLSVISVSLVGQNYATIFCYIYRIWLRVLTECLVGRTPVPVCVCICLCLCGINKITLRVYVGRVKERVRGRLRDRDKARAKVVYLTVCLNLLLWPTSALFLCKSADLYFGLLSANLILSRLARTHTHTHT